MGHPAKHATMRVSEIGYVGMEKPVLMTHGGEVYSEVIRKLYKQFVRLTLRRDREYARVRRDEELFGTI
jgi:hypothetical protein